jgi:MFS family permease
MMAASLSIQGATVLMLFWAQDPWVFYLFAAAFGLGFGGEWTGYLVINRQYFGEGPMGTLYGWQTTGALMGHAVATALAGLVLYATGSYNLILGLSMAFSLTGVVVITTLDSTSRLLIPHWEESLPPEARSEYARAPAAAPSAAGDG